MRFLSEQLVIKTSFDVLATSKEDMIQQLVDKCVAENIVLPESQEAVYKAFITREEQGTTGLVDGFAIPHAENSNITQAALLIYKLKEPIEWESMDGQPIQFVFGILVPSMHKGTVHLKILSEIAKMLMKKEAKEALILADSEAAVIEVINRYITIA